MVRDTTGGVIEGAEVVIRNTGADIARAVRSGKTGDYRAVSLEPGEYTISATKEGFKTAVRDSVILLLDRQTIVDLTLEIGEVSDSVTVEGRVRNIEAFAGAISAVVDGRSIRNLPLNGRDYIELATLEAGAPVARAQARNSNMGRGVQISISGSRPQQNNFRLDGVSLNDYTGSTPGGVNGLNLGVEAIAEFSVLSHTYSAQYGRAAGGVINAVTRSGGKEFHGSAYYFHRNDALDARNFFDREKPEFRRNQFGGSLGGPLAANRVFFFTNYEGMREQRGNTTTNTTLSQDARRGLLRSGTVRVDPVMAKTAALFPEPNSEVFGDTALFVFANDVTSRDDFVTSRVDAVVNGRDTLMFRYTLGDSEREDETDFAVNRRLNTARNQSLVFEHTHLFSPAIINSARFGYSRTSVVNGLTAAQNPAADDPELAFLPGRDSIGIINVSGLTLFPGGTGALDADIHIYDSFQFYDHVSWNLGRHSIRMGGSFERLRLSSDSQSRVSGDFRFRGIARFLTNDPDRFRAQLPGSDTFRDFRQAIGAWYVEDSWKISRRLTFDLGLRHEWTSVPTEADGKLSNLDELTSTEVRVGGPLFDNPSLKNFAPRVGLAWDPRGDGKTVVRAGYGIFHDPLLVHFLLLQSFRNPPFFLRGNTRDLSLGDFPKGGFEKFADAARTDLRVGRIPRDLSQPYVQQWNFTIERALPGDSLLRLSYVGSHGLHLSAIEEDANLVQPEILPDGRRFFPADGERLNPAFGWLRNRPFDSRSSYNALQAKFETRLGSSLQLQAGYTWANSIDDSSSSFAQSESANSIGVPVTGDVGFNRGPSNHDVRHYFVLHGLWEPPSPRGGPARAVFGDWRIGGIGSYAAGLPFSATLGYDAARTRTSREGWRSGQRPDVNPSFNGNPITGDPNRWFDPRAFLRPTPGFLGNLGRNALRGPDSFNVDFSLTKRVQLRDSSAIEIRFEAFNLLNRTNFDLPSGPRTQVFGEDGAIEDAGRIVSARESRELQFGIRLVF